MNWNWKCDVILYGSLAAMWALGFYSGLSWRK